MTDLTANITGTVVIAPSGQANNRGSSGCAMGITILESNRSPREEVSQARARIESPSPAWQALPWPAVLEGRVLYIRATTSAPFSVRLTKGGGVGQETLTGQVGHLSMEVSPDNPLTGVEVQGSVEIEWAAWGTRT